MRTKLYLLCFLCLCVYNVSAQNSESRLRLFTDYGKCYYGLKDKSGKEIWKAEFTSLYSNYVKGHKDSGGYQYFWIAEKNGYCGVLNDSGKVVVPFQFKQVLLSKHGCFVAKNDQDIIIYKLKGEKWYTDRGADEIQPLENGFIVTKNGKKGFLDLQLRECIPFDFTDIKPVVMRRLQDSNIELFSPHTFHVFREKETGIYDLRRGMVIPCIYEFTEVHWANADCAESQAIYVAFRDSLLFMYNSAGILADSQNSHNPPTYYQFPFNSCGSEADAFAILNFRDVEGNVLRMEVTNLGTKEHSASYDWAWARGNRFLCKKGKRWSVMDEHFKELGHWTKWNASWEIRLREIFEPWENRSIWWNLSEDPVWIDVNRGRNLVTIYGEPSKHSEFLSFGMYDYETEKHTSTDYYSITPLEYRQQRVYWTFKIAKENRMYIGNELRPAYSQLDIYDENLNLLRSFHGEEEMPYYEFREKNTSLRLFVHPQGDYYGAINVRGDQIIPAKYEDFGEVRFLNEAGSRDDEIFYLFGNNNLLSVFDCDGKQIISEGHTQYMSMGNCFIAINPDGTYEIYTKEGNKLLDGVSSYFAATKSSGKRDCSYLRGNTNPSGNLFLFVKGDQLYYFLDEKLSLAGPGTFEFTSVYLRLYGNIIIDQQGKIVDVTGTKLSQWYGGCPVQLQKLPVQIEVAAKPIPKMPERNYQWKPGSDYKTKENWWMLTDLSGKNLSNRHFDYPFDPKSRMGKIFKVEGKYGLMFEEFKETLPPEYDYIFPVINKGYVVYKDMLWQFYNPTTDLFSPDKYDVISTHDWHGKRLVFKNGKVGILTDSLTYLIPLTDSLEFVRKFDLIKLLQLEKESKFDLSSTYQIISNGKPSQIYKMLNNGQLIWFAYQRSTANRIMEISPVDENFLSSHPKISFRNLETIAVKKPQAHTAFYYTEEVESHNRSMYNYFEIPSYDARTQQYFNYKIVGGKLIPIQLKDVIGSEFAMKKLDNLLTEKLTEKQYFGQSCTDIAAKIERLKANCLIRSNSLKFHWPDYPKFEFEISFSELNGILTKEFQKQVSEF